MSDYLGPIGGIVGSLIFEFVGLYIAATTDPVLGANIGHAFMIGGGIGLVASVIALFKV